MFVKAVTIGTLLSLASAWFATVNYLGFFPAAPGICFATLATGQSAITCAGGSLFAIFPGNVLAYVPATYLILWWLGRRPARGVCHSCRYDLTGNVSGVCPECGTEVEAK